MLRSRPWSAETCARWWQWSLWPLAAVIGLAGEWRLFGWADRRDWVPDLLTGWVLIGCGLISWSRRPDSRSGALLAATGFAWFVPNFATTGIGALDWVGVHALYLHRGPLLAAVLTYPRGRVIRRVEKAAVAGGSVFAIVTPLWRNEDATIGLATLLVIVAVRNYLGAVGAERRMRRAALHASTWFAVVLVAIALLRLAFVTRAATETTLLVYQASLCALAIGLVIGLFRASWEGAEVIDLVVELGETGVVTLRDALARAIGDPRLQLGYWHADAGGFLDSDGRPVQVPDPASGRATTTVRWEGRPVALLVHDATVLDDRGLVEAVESAANLADANARLQDEVHARLADIRASRRRIVEAGDEERARLERRLRDGAQRRLDDLAATLQEANQSAVGRSTAERIAHAMRQLSRGREELRRLARGIHPRELSELGLAGTLATLAADCPLPVEVSASGIEAPPSVGTCVYFVCSEALANVVKYAAASHVQIMVRSDAAATTAEVADDGVGGADPGHGTGLRGLADRVEALGGTFTVVSPAGGGTRLRATIPSEVGTR